VARAAVRAERSSSVTNATLDVHPWAVPLVFVRDGFANTPVVRFAVFVTSSRVS
jgi:hypothetical protein